MVDLSPLKDLVCLEHISLNNTCVTDITQLKGLAGLQDLDLSYTRVADISPLIELTSLKELHLHNTQVANIAPIERLIGLQVLNLSGTQVADVSSLKYLTRLQRLWLSNTRVADISSLRGLSQMKFLYLDNTQIADIGEIIPLIIHGLSYSISPLPKPPIEIVLQGNSAILRYWGVEDTVPLYEAKVLLVGEPKSGKTTLYNQMFAPEKGMPEEDDRTEGIDIHQWHYNLKNGKEMRLNIWDFGGQEILHATHQFFLTKRSVYILLDNTASNHKTVQDAYFRDWLGWIELLGGDSPILIFQNEMKGHLKEIGMDGIKGRFPNVLNLYKGNLNSAEAAKGIKEALEHFASHLPHIGEKWPRKWLEIRKEMEEIAMTTPFISYEAYLELCRKHGETDERKALDASQAFHHLGVCLHFWEDRLLRRIVILKNEWATDPVYKIIRDAEITLKKGRFTQADLDRIWSDQQYVHHHQELLALMERFELCYPLPGAKPESWLVPQLLPVEPPKPFPFVSSAGDLVLRYKYRYMPKGILNRLMTRMHRYVADASKAWVVGVIFEKQGSSLLAEVSASGDELVLRAKGQGTAAFDLLTIIADDLDDLSAQFEHQPEKWVPCNCGTCAALETPHFYEHEALTERLQHGRRTVECGKPPYLPANVVCLLTGIGLAPVARESFEKALEPEEKGLKTVRIFLSSSSDLYQERVDFEIFIGRENKRMVSKGVFLQLEMRGNMATHLTEAGTQAGHNQIAEECDLFVSLFFTKVESGTEAEFDAALARFKSTGAPLIFTYFQNAPLMSGAITPDVLSMLNFQERLKGLGHFVSEFTNTQDLQFKFRAQLERILDRF